MAVDGVSLPFQEAIDFFRRKVNLPTAKSDDLRHGAHVRAFSVAGVTRDDMLADFRVALDRARSQGTGYEAFRKDFDAIVERTGWKFYARGDTEEKRRAWRARVIYKTNMRTSYMAGRYAQMTEPAVLRYRPFWRYKHSDAIHPRPKHLAMDGKIWAANDPIWKVIYPPNGWGCGCDVEALSKRQMAALGKSGPDAKPEWLEPYETTDPRTGQVETRYPGIDRGWEYNVGEAAVAGPVPAELQAPLPPVDAPAAVLVLPPMPEPTTASANRILAPDLEPEAYVSAFLEEFGATPVKPQLWRDPSGGIVTIDRSLFDKRRADGSVTSVKADKRGRGPYMLLLADAIRDPDEIWVDWAKVASGTVLRRSYLKRVLLPDGQELFLRFEWTSKGWVGVTAFRPDGTEDTSYLEGQRKGAMLYRRNEKGEPIRSEPA